MQVTTSENGKKVDLFANATQIESTAPRVYAQFVEGNEFRGYLVGEQWIPDANGEEGSMRRLFILETDAPCKVVGKEGEENADPHEVPAGSLVYVGDKAALRKLGEFLDGPFLTGIKIRVGKEKKLDKGRRMHACDVWAVRTSKPNPNYGQKTRAMTVVNDDADIPF